MGASEEQLYAAAEADFKFRSHSVHIAQHPAAETNVKTFHQLFRESMIHDKSDYQEFVNAALLDFANSQLSHRSIMRDARQVAKLSRLNQYFIDGELTKIAEDKILNWIREETTGIEIPACTSEGHTLDKFQRVKLNRMFAIHVCPKGCIAYIGPNQKELQCRICKTYRFKKCKLHGCENKARSQCKHRMQQRYPYKELYYYSIYLRILYDIHIGKLPQELYDDNDPDLEFSDHLSCDITATSTARKGLQEMNAKFAIRALEFERKKESHSNIPGDAE